jgi:hypothetical protein
MADGGTTLNQALAWVFDFSRSGHRQRRDLRFWRPELEARGSGDAVKNHQFSQWELDAVIKRILPETRQNYRAWDVSDLFQIRHNTRIRLFGGGGKIGSRNSYSRQALAEFLRKRWLGGRRAKSPAGRCSHNIRPIHESNSKNQKPCKH